MSRTYQRGDEPIPGFRLVKLLGAGGCGEVWQATAPGGIDVALKFIILAGRMGLKEFRSLQLVKRIHHPNLTPIHAFWPVDSSGALLEALVNIEDSLAEDTTGRGDSTGKPAFRVKDQETLLFSSRAVPTRSGSATRPSALILAMGLGDRSLTERLEECQEQGLEGIPLDELMDYMDGAAAGIDFLNSPRHDLGSGPVAIQHCDIKPRNLLIVGGAVQVCDFGLARLTDSQITSMALSAAYGAPETWRGERPRPTTDQYSLAISYYELRTGTLPFEENSQMAVMNAHLEGKLQLSKLPEGERMVIARATSVLPEDRFESCRAMVAALRQSRRIAAAAQPRHQAIPIERKHDWRWAAGLVSLFALLIGMFAMRDYLYTRDARDPAVTPSPVAVKPWLPANFAAAPGAQQITADQFVFFDRIQREIEGMKVDFILVPRNAEHRLPLELPSFYIMENKVAVGLFRAFAKDQPDEIQQSYWEDVATNKLEPERPVMGVFVEDAHSFAVWLGGEYARLPSVEQWDKAAGRNYHEQHKDCGHTGPFRSDWNARDPSQIAINCDTPLPVGTATHDISHPFNCRDMAGNGYEWTRNLQGNNSLTIPLQIVEPFASVTLRGQTFIKPLIEAGSIQSPLAEPLTYHDLSSIDRQAAAQFEYGLPDVGFRVVIECVQGAEIDRSTPERPSP